MADIKTRDAVKGTIKTIDKAAIATERMKSAYAKTKGTAEQGCYADESSAAEYAADRLSYGADRIKDEGIHQFNKQGQKAVKETRENIGKAKDKILSYKQKKAAKAAEQNNNGLQIRHGAASRSSAPDSTQRAKSQFIKTRQQGKKTIKTTARNTEKTVRATAKGTVKTTQKSVKTAQATSKAAIKTAEHTAKATKAAAKASAKATAKATVTAVKAAVKATIAAVKAIIAGVKALAGKIATGDLFVGDSATKAAIEAKCAPDCVEMEGAAVSQIAAKNDVPCVILRAMSDNADEDGHEVLVVKKFSITEYVATATKIVAAMVESL